MLTGMLILGAVIVVVAGGLAGIYWVRRALLTRLAETYPRCRQCGYNLTGLEIPRCPECGSAVGFDRTFEELGVSEDEVRRHVENRGRDTPPARNTTPTPPRSG